MAKKKAPGFSAFETATADNPLFGPVDTKNRVLELELDRVKPNPDQPRKSFDKTKLEELARSIRENGLLQPILVAKTEDDGYLVVAGERRFRAHQILELETIRAIMTTGEPDAVALIENVQREDLDPLEEAAAYQQMMERHGYSQGDLEKIVGKKRNTINEILSLNRLSPVAIKSIQSADSPVSKAVLIEIVKAGDAEAQEALAKEAIDHDLSVRAIRERRKETDPSPTPTKSSQVKAASARKDRLIRSLAATVKRLSLDGRPEDFPQGSEALERIKELKRELDEQLKSLIDQPRLTDEKA